LVQVFRLLKLSRLKLLTTFISSNKQRKADVSFVDEQTYAVEFYHGNKLVSYAYFDTVSDADREAEKYILEVENKQ
jgi:hypothetical protein